MEQKQGREELLTRLVLCAGVAAGLVYAGETLLEGKGIDLWEKYGPWIKENKVQAIAIGAVCLYLLSLALWPEGKALPKEEGFTPCT